LAVEQRLVESATGRTGGETARVSHQAVGEALAAHVTAGTDQQAMVRDLCQGGHGVAVVVGRAGTGKTFALGIARHAWQLDGYRLLASAPTGIATMSLQGEGFEDVATCDRLLGDLDRGAEQVDARTVLVVDEAGMVGSRKLTRLLKHAQQAQAKVVLVGDDRQLAPIDAGGGFRALRLRLGASDLVENRRQQQAWEREALDLVRSGLVEEAVAAYQAHDRVVAADSKPAVTLALLQDWWTAWRQAEGDSPQEVIVLAARRAEVDRLNTACQELLAAQGRLGHQRLQVEDRQLAVGDRVVCGHNAIGELGVANGSRGVVTALDPDARTLTIRRQQAEEALAAHQQAGGGQPGGMLGWLRPSNDQPAQMLGGLAVATQQANRAHDRERELRQHQQRRDGWLEANADLGPQYRQVVRILAWQRRATGVAVEQERPGYVLEALGPVPESTRGRRAWRQAAAQIEHYRRTYQITDPDRALGPEPRDPAQRADRQRVRTAIDRVQAKQRATDRTRDTQPTAERTNQHRPQERRSRPGPERAVG
jgi:hypothetical protein